MTERAMKYTNQAEGESTITYLAAIHIQGLDNRTAY